MEDVDLTATRLVEDVSRAANLSIDKTFRQRSGVERLILCLNRSTEFVEALNGLLKGDRKTAHTFEVRISALAEHPQGLTQVTKALLGDGYIAARTIS